jgi:hypothetical protein
MDGPQAPQVVALSLIRVCGAHGMHQPFGVNKAHAAAPVYGRQGDRIPIARYACCPRTRSRPGTYLTSHSTGAAMCILRGQGPKSCIPVVLAPTGSKRDRPHAHCRGRQPLQSPGKQSSPMQQYVRLSSAP